MFGRTPRIICYQERVIVIPAKFVGTGSGSLQKKKLTSFFTYPILNFKTGSLLKLTLGSLLNRTLDIRLK